MFKKSNFSVILFFILGAMVLQSSKCPKDAPEPTPQVIVTADFSIVQAANCPAPCQVCFTNASQNATSFQWDFGNGQTSTQTSPCVTYSERGTYTVRLTATSGTDTKVQTKQVIVATDNIARFKEVVPLSNQIARNVLVTPNGYVYVRYTNSALGLFNIKRYGPYNAAGGLTNSVDQGYNTSNINVADMVADTDNSLLLVGNGVGSSAALIKYTNTGALVFQSNSKYQNTANTFGSSVVPTGDGNYIVVGSKPIWNTGDKVGGYIAKIGSAGTKISEDVIGLTPSNDDRIIRVFKNLDNTYTGIGVKTDPVQNKTDIFISRINNAGNGSIASGADIIGRNNNENDVVNDAVQIAGYEFALVGRYGGAVTFGTFERNGSVVINYFKVIKSFPNLLSLTGICTLGQGASFTGFGVCGVTTDNKIFVAKLDGAGNIIWQKTYGNAGFLTLPDIAYTFWDGGFVVVAEETCPDVSGCLARPIIMKMDRNGDIN
jgi:PKD repeat protein